MAKSYKTFGSDPTPIEKEDFAKKTIAELVALHNSVVADDKKVASFKNKDAALEATWKVGTKAAAPPKPAKEPKEKVAKEPKARRIKELTLPAKPAAERKQAHRGTAVETCLILASSGTLTVDQIAAQSIGKDGQPQPRNQVVGTILWCSKGLGWGFKHDKETDLLQLVDENGDAVTYDPKVDPGIQKAAAKAARDAKRAEEKAERDAKRAAEKAAKDAAKAAEKERKAQVAAAQTQAAAQA